MPRNVVYSLIAVSKPQTTSIGFVLRAFVQNAACHSATKMGPSEDFPVSLAISVCLNFQQNPSGGLG